jgi:hypothetical protein
MGPYHLFGFLNLFPNWTTYMRKNLAAPPVFDRRRTPRHEVRHVGVIQTKPTAPRQYCMVTDESEGGVRIVHTSANLEPPTEFTLWFAGTEGKYRVVWHKGLFIGAELITSLKPVEAPTNQSPATETLSEAAV